YIIVCASASKYGDYFTGGVGSTLWIADFELEYDY
ncbi:MAG: PCMD domain-containing protein, partial [Muribaculaceae bacterium]|nr:PCMD domain-containing protein [Muribaculaceae bacterium]